MNDVPGLIKGATLLALLLIMGALALLILPIAILYTLIEKAAAMLLAYIILFAILAGLTTAAGLHGYLIGPGSMMAGLLGVAWGMFLVMGLYAFPSGARE